MKKRIKGEMTAAKLGQVASLFLDSELHHEIPLLRFKLDHYHPKLQVAFEYDGPEHYNEVGHIERDVRKALACKENAINLKRWPYYFQLTRDIARYIFGDFYSDKKYSHAITLVYGTGNEADVLAPGLHNSKHTPANFVHRGIERFFREIDDAPESVRSQVVRSFQIYQKRLGPDRKWLLFPENDDRFTSFMLHKPNDEHLKCFYPFHDAPN